MAALPDRALRDLRMRFATLEQIYGITAGCNGNPILLPTRAPRLEELMEPDQLNSDDEDHTAPLQQPSARERSRAQQAAAGRGIAQQNAAECGRAQQSAAERSRAQQDAAECSRAPQCAARRS